MATGRSRQMVVSAAIKEPPPSSSSSAAAKKAAKQKQAETAYAIHQRYEDTAFIVFHQHLRKRWDPNPGHYTLLSPVSASGAPDTHAIPGIEELGGGGEEKKTALQKSSGGGDNEDSPSGAPSSSLHDSSLFQEGNSRFFLDAASAESYAVPGNEVVDEVWQVPSSPPPPEAALSLAEGGEDTLYGASDSSSEEEMTPGIARESPAHPRSSFEKDSFQERDPQVSVQERDLQEAVQERDLQASGPIENEGVPAIYPGSPSFAETNGESSPHPAPDNPSSNEVVSPEYTPPSPSSNEVTSPEYAPASLSSHEIASPEFGISDQTSPHKALTTSVSHSTEERSEQETVEIFTPSPFNAPGGVTPDSSTNILDSGPDTPRSSSSRDGSVTASPRSPLHVSVEVMSTSSSQPPHSVPSPANLSASVESSSIAESASSGDHVLSNTLSQTGDMWVSVSHTSSWETSPASSPRSREEVSKGSPSEHSFNPSDNFFTSPVRDGADVSRVSSPARDFAHVSTVGSPTSSDHSFSAPDKDAVHVSSIDSPIAHVFTTSSPIKDAAHVSTTSSPAKDAAHISSSPVRDAAHVSYISVSSQDSGHISTVNISADGRRGSRSGSPLKASAEAGEEEVGGGGEEEESIWVMRSDFPKGTTPRSPGTNSIGGDGKGVGDFTRDPTSLSSQAGTPRSGEAEGEVSHAEPARAASQHEEGGGQASGRQRDILVSTRL